ncbi:MAG: cation:proton antiporter [Phycisphaerales bacterium JB040]
MIDHALLLDGPLSPLGAGGGPAPFAVDLLKILACAGLVAAVLGRLRIAVIPGYLIAGAIIGPGGLGLIGDSDTVGEITSVATVLLMFGIGLHLDTSALRQGAASIVAAGVLSTVGSAMLATPIAMAFGLTPPEAIAVGLAVSMSSTAVVMRLLQQKRELYSAHGRMCFGILLVQDLLVVVMLSLLPVLADMGPGSEPEATPSVAIDEAASGYSASPPIWLALVTVALMIAVGKLVLPWFMQQVARGRSEEILLVIAAAVALGAAVLTGRVGLSPELGAFVAGFILSSTPFRFQLSGQISPMRDLFMAVFFTAVGLELNLTGILPQLHVVLACTLIVLVMKTTVIAGVAWGVGASMPVAIRSGLTLAQAGEFSLLLVATAGGLGLLGAEVSSVLIATIVLTLILTPTLDTLGAGLSGRIMHLPVAPWFKQAAIGATPVLADIEDDEDACPVQAASPCRVIVAGFGPVARACVERLDREGISCTIVELNPHTVRTQAALGRSIIYGDVTNPEVLERAGIDRAEAIIITMPDHEAMLRAVSIARRMRPDIDIAARANLLSVAMRAKELGASRVAVEEIAVAEHLAKHAIRITTRAEGKSEEAQSTRTSDTPASEPGE